MHIEIELLGTVNEGISPEAALQPKYVARVTAEQLAQWFTYERKGSGKTAPFRVASHSLIRIDPDIQRGIDPYGFALQQPSKILEIAQTLLGMSAIQVPRLYLGSLTWNVRIAENGFQTIRIETGTGPAKWRLAFDTPGIFLTDSAHRHFGIVEAYRLWMLSSAKFPRFSPKLEFSVEIYNLDKQREKELFSELNSKQKKISAAKQKQMDVSSPIGALKDAVQDYDRGSARLFEKNIEVSSNQNDKHTLITMSVFVASIDEMFSLDDIREARDESDLRAELAEYYCEFFYELAQTIVVKADLGDGEREHRPFRNLYNEIIKPTEDLFDPNHPQESEQRLEVSRKAAVDENQKLRRVDVANHNAFIKALSRLGATIRGMDNWASVIQRLQTALNVPTDGHFFQKSNQALFATESSSDIPIASLNDDGTINIQVQTKNINKIYAYLMRVLDLVRDPALYLHDEHHTPHMIHGGGTESWQVSSDGETFRGVELYFYTPKSAPDFPVDLIRLDVESEDWSKATSKGKKSGFKPTTVERDPSYVDPTYEDIVRWRAVFEIRVPPASSMNSNSAQLKLKATFPPFASTGSPATLSHAIQATRS